MYFFRLHCHDTYVYANLTMDVFGLRVLLAANDSTAQPGSTPGCSASVSKNHNTISTTPKCGEGGANRVRVALGVSFACTLSRYVAALLDNWKVGSQPAHWRAINPEPSRTCERVTTREHAVTDVDSHY